MKIPRLCSLLLFGLLPSLTAQDLEITTVDGRRIRAEVRGLTGTGAGAQLQLGTEGETLPLSLVLAMHGVAPGPMGGVTVGLVGGDELRGRLRAGNSNGETFLVESPSLGPVTIQVDRLREMVLRPGVRGDDLRIPEGAEDDEALFLPTEGARLDILTGAVHRFTDSGVVFQENGQEPRHVSYQSLAGIALRGGLEREEPASVYLITRTGDALGVELVGIRAGRFRFALEGGQEVELPAEEISALSFRGDGRLYLSDLMPVSVEEGSYFGDDVEPIYPYRRDRTVTGNFLVAEGRTYVKGLGVHSRSRLGFRVPEGFSKFSCLVAVDDEVRSLGLRADVDLRVLQGEVTLFSLKGLRSGDPVRNIGVLDVIPGQVLTLEVEFGKGLGLVDRVDWLSAVFLK